LPRDVEPTVTRLPNVFLYNLDDLAKIAEENRSARESEVVRAQALIAEKAGALWPRMERLCRNIEVGAAATSRPLVSAR
jgi:glutamyl-tRNA reductase